MPVAVEQPTAAAARLAAARIGLAADATTAARARRSIFAWWLGSRVLVFAAAAIAQIAGFPSGRQPSFLTHPFSLLGHWDGRWYEIVARGGYVLIPHRPSDPAFFPLLPILERLGHGIGVPYVVAGVLVANLGFLVGLVALYELGRELLPEADARRAATYLAVFPFGFVFSLAYPEGLALPLVLLAALFAVRRSWLAAAFCAAGATLARPEALFLVLPLAAIAFRTWPTASESTRARAVAAVLAPAAALASFSGYLWWTLGDPHAWSTAERAWNRSFSVRGVYNAVLELLAASKHHNEWLYRDAAFCLAYLLLLRVAYRAGVPRSWVAAGLCTVLFPLASGSFTSDARFGLLAPSVFWGLATLGRRRSVDFAVLALSPVLLGVSVFTIPLHWP
jgi:hypothetical protein